MKERIHLCFGPVLFCLLDGSLTLLGQPAEYWAGNWHYANELNPLGYWGLGQHPYVFAVLLAGWMALVAALILLLPARFAIVVSLAVQAGHTLGAASWLLRAFGILGCVPLVLLSRVLMDRAWRSRVSLATDN
jgi:hypothetical protein